MFERMHIWGYIQARKKYTKSANPIYMIKPDYDNSQSCSNLAFQEIPFLKTRFYVCKKRVIFNSTQEGTTTRKSSEAEIKMAQNVVFRGHLSSNCMVFFNCFSKGAFMLKRMGEKKSRNIAPFFTGYSPLGKWRDIFQLDQH